MTWDASRVQAAAQDAIGRLMDLGYEVQTCFVDFGETAEVVSDILRYPYSSGTNVWSD
jgi:hypothetical protein